MVEMILYLWLLLALRRDSTYPYAEGLLKRTRERCPFQKLQRLRSHAREKGDDTEITAIDG